MRGETTDLIFETNLETTTAVLNNKITTELAGFLHRPDTISAPTNCSVRARLTPSIQSQVGAMWYEDNVPVNNGFETHFTFQMSDHSKECTLRKDQYFSQRSYESCSVRGGDGFAFVIQADPRGINATGLDGGQMGFGGIKNSLAIAFDTWQNPGQDSLFTDHIRYCINLFIKFLSLMLLIFALAYSLEVTIQMMPWRLGCLEHLELICLQTGKSIWLKLFTTEKLSQVIQFNLNSVYISK
jgi:hypothetical protein